MQSLLVQVPSKYTCRTLTFEKAATQIKEHKLLIHYAANKLKLLKLPTNACTDTDSFSTRKVNKPLSVDSAPPSDPITSHSKIMVNGSLNEKGGLVFWRGKELGH